MIKVNTSQMPEHVCEFCNLKFWIDETNFAVIHQEPYCAKFGDLDILDFLRENREIKTARNN